MVDDETKAAVTEQKKDLVVVERELRDALHKVHMVGTRNEISLTHGRGEDLVSPLERDRQRTAQLGEFSERDVLGVFGWKAKVGRGSVNIQINPFLAPHSLSPSAVAERIDQVNILFCC